MRSIPRSLAISLFLSLFVVSPLILAQSDKTSTTPPEIASKLPPGAHFVNSLPHYPHLTDNANELYVAYWTLEPGWHTTIELRNNLRGRNLTISPSLRLPNGSEIALQDVMVKPDEIVPLDLYEALVSVKPVLVGKSGTYGSAVLRYKSPFTKNLYAGSMLHREGAPIAYHFDAIPKDQAFDATDRESIWWLPNPTTDGLLLITNAWLNLLR